MGAASGAGHCLHHPLRCPRRCVSSLLVKWKALLPQAQLVKLCTLGTLAALLPGMALQLRDARGVRLLASMALSALSFYLFSYQVWRRRAAAGLMRPAAWWAAAMQHWGTGSCTAPFRGARMNTGIRQQLRLCMPCTSEPAVEAGQTYDASRPPPTARPVLPRPLQVHEKSILLVLAPMAALPAEHLPVAAWAAAVGVCSMGPLLVKDGLVLASLGVLAIYAVVAHLLASGQPAAAGRRPLPAWWRRAAVVSAAGMACLAVLAKACAPPPRLPYLWDALAMAWSFPHFAAAYLYLHFV